MEFTVDSASIQIGLKELGEELVKELQDDLERKKVNASKRFSESLQVDVIGNTMTISGNPYYVQIEKGAKPKRGGNPSWKDAVKDIRQWIDNKGIPYEKGMEYAILKSIFAKGTLMAQGKGRYDKPISFVLNSEDIIQRVIDKSLGQRELFTVTETL